MDIKGLREKCQSARKECDTWHGRNIARRVSIYITVLFVKFGIGAMAATTIFLLSGIIACLTFCTGSRWAFLAGALILQLWYILDHVDGEVARYNGESSLTGIYYDEVSHYIVHPAVFFGIGAGLFRLTGNSIFLFAAFTSGLGLVLLGLTGQLKKLVIFEHAGVAAAQEDGGYMFDLPEGGGSLAKRIFMRLHAACTFPFIMNAITLFAAIDVLLRARTVAILFIVYTVTINIVWILRLTIFVRQRRIDIGAGKGNGR